jgi:hypothetical protein
MPTSVCLLSQTPYLSVLKSCLTTIYPRLVINPNDMSMVLEDLMSDLACVPQPPAGVASVAFRLHDGLGAPDTDGHFITCRSVITGTLVAGVNIICARAWLKEHAWVAIAAQACSFNQTSYVLVSFCQLLTSNQPSFHTGMMSRDAGRPTIRTYQSLMSLSEFSLLPSPLRTCC